MASTTASLSSPGTATTSTLLATSSSNSSQGILQHGNPVIWTASDPIALFVIQAFIIVVLCWLLHLPMKMIRQPRVISEFITGIILGPSVMGHIPKFTATIFPTANGALAPLTLVGNLGLIFFLFLVGVEADLRFLGRNWKTAAAVATLGMVIPFACGAAIAWGLYTEFHSDPGLAPIPFGVFLLFVAVAMSITAFPVLCRILVELKLLHTPVGIVALSAGIANDVVGWTLLALCVALAKASDGIVALYVLLVCVGFILFLYFAVRPTFLWLLRKNRAAGGPNQGMVTLTVMMVLVSAWFTDAIGIHAIFGAFLVGLIIPHDDSGFAVEITEKIEQFISGLFVPVFFALSGLNTNLGLLNDGITWAYVIAIIVIAFVTKIAGGSIAARLTGRMWRESFAIGSLMSCKGVVELIALNIGYNAHILSQRTFTMFVLMTLITTFATTPLVNWLYPQWYQRKLESWRRGEIDWDGHPIVNEKAKAERSTEISRMAVHLRLDTLPGVLALLALFVHRDETDMQVQLSKEAADISSQQTVQQPLQVQAIRMREIADREFSVITASNTDEESRTDPILNIFRVALEQITHTQVAVHGKTLQSLPESYVSEFLDYIDGAQVDMMLLSGKMSEIQAGLGTLPSERLGNLAFSDFVGRISSHPTDHKIAVFIDNGFGQQNALVNSNSTWKSALSIRETKSHFEPLASPKRQGHHIFLPFFGTQDDLAALHLVLQLAKNSSITATIAHFQVNDSVTENTQNTTGNAKKDPTPNTSATTSHEVITLQTVRGNLPATLSDRVSFETISMPSVDFSTELVLSKASSEVDQNPRNTGDLIVLGWNEDHHILGNKKRRGSEVGKALGAAGALLESLGKLNASFLVLRAPTRKAESA